LGGRLAPTLTLLRTTLGRGGRRTTQTRKYGEGADGSKGEGRLLRLWLGLWLEAVATRCNYRLW
jgi:hypothetical protein